MPIERPKLSSFRGLEGEPFMALHTESGHDCGLWKLGDVKVLDSLPITGLEDLECFSMLFLSGEHFPQGYYTLKSPGSPEAEEHQLFCTPTIALKGDPAMQVVIN